MKIDKYGIAHFYDGGEGGGGDPSGGSDPGGGGGGGGDPGGGGSDVSAADGVGMSGFDSIGNFGGYDAGPGPGGTDVRDQISSVFGGTGPGLNIAGPMSPEDPEVLADYASGRIGSNWSSSRGKEARSILDQLEDMGYGKMEGINPRNPSQTVDNLIASSRANWAIENIGIPALLSAVPGANAFMTGLKGIAGIIEGRISPGQTVANTAVNIAASKLGLPVGTFTAVLNGNMGKAAANTAMGVMNQTISSLTGIPSNVVGFGMNVTGLGAKANQAITDTVNQGLGITPSNNIAAVGSAIDRALGFTPGQGFDFDFDSTGQFAPNFSDTSSGGAEGIGGISSGPGSSGGGGGGLGSIDIPSDDTGGGKKATPISQAGDSLGVLSALPALSALSSFGPQEDNSNKYQASRIPVKSPFGLMYGVDKTGPYGMRG